MRERLIRQLWLAAVVVAFCLPLFVGLNRTDMENDEAIYEECRGIRDGGGFGSIIGRNSFQRPKPRALEFLSTVMKIYSGELK